MAITDEQQQNANNQLELANMAITDKQQQNANNQLELANQTSDDITNQLKRQLGTLDFANRQNRALADRQLQQADQKAALERFQSQLDLQDAAKSVANSMAPGAFNSSMAGNLENMIANRNAKENTNYWNQLKYNKDQIENEYIQQENQNRIGALEAAADAEKGQRDIEANTAARLNNLSPELYTAPGRGDLNLNTGRAWDQAGGYNLQNHKISGFGNTERGGYNFFNKVRR